MTKGQSESAWHALEDLMSTQKFGVLATHDHGQPYTSLMAFACSTDLVQLIFITPASSKKYANLVSDPRAAMLIDSRSNTSMDIEKAMAATATGTVEMASGDSLITLKGIYLEKHPYLADFAASHSTRLIVLRVSRYFVVDQFQHVVEIDMTS
ncbi:MAG: pyridoxamine 5'-phosphate oxidase family protein [Desulfobacterales bacterium]